MLGEDTLSLISKANTAVIDVATSKRTTRSPELAERILALVADSKPLREVAQEVDCSPTFIKSWIVSDKDFAAKYARAKQEFAEDKADEIIAMADKAIGAPAEVVQAVKNAIDARKWIISKLLPKKYGERPDEVHVAVNNITVSTEKLRELQERRQLQLRNT